MVECDTNDVDDVNCELLGAIGTANVVEIIDIEEETVEEVADEAICVGYVPSVDEVCEEGINEVGEDLLLNLGEGCASIEELFEMAYGGELLRGASFLVMADAGEARRAAASRRAASTLMMAVAGRVSSADDNYEPTRGYRGGARTSA